MLDCLSLAENVFDGRRILLVSHGDPLQILLTFFNDLPAGQHRDIPHLDVAEIRNTQN